MYPLISCVCPTVGKTKHLEEALQSFLIQTYPNKELIIFNNYPKIDFVFDHPQVKVVNYKGIINGIGDARNKGNNYASGDYICTWDDDDISLLERIWTMYQDLTIYSNPKAGIIGGAFYSEANTILKKDNFFASNSLISREYLSSIQYEKVDNDDWTMVAELRKHDQLVIYTGIPDYIYRWKTGTYHVSGHADTVQNNRQRILNWADSLNLPSQYQLTPYWERDYQNDVDLFMKSVA